MSDSETLLHTLAAIQADKRLPPVGQWHPAREGRIDIRIAADGTWYHEGAPIRRPGMVKIFSSVLRRDADGYCLVTPAEKLLIDVEDAPFLAIDMEVSGSGEGSDLLFTTNVDDYVVVDADHPLWVDEMNGQPRPYVHVRDGLDALINRPVFYRLVELGTRVGDECCVYSRGRRFSLGTVVT